MGFGFFDEPEAPKKQAKEAKPKDTQPKKPSKKKSGSSAGVILPTPGTPLKLPTTWTPPTEFPRLHGVLGFDVETRDPRLKVAGPGWAWRDGGEVTGVSFSWDGGKERQYWPMRHAGGGNLDATNVLRWVQDVVGDPNNTIVGHNLTYDLGWLKREGVDVKAKSVCTYTVAALLDEYRRSYSLDNVARDYLGEQKNETGLMNALAAYGLPGKDYIWALPSFYVGEYAGADAQLALRLWDAFQKPIAAESLSNIVQLELDLIPIWVAMRWRGIRVDVERAENAVQMLRLEYEEFLAKVEKRLGQKLDPWSAESLADACHRLKLDHPRTARGAPSFQGDWLESHPHPIMQAVPKLRTLDKIRGTFIQSYFLDSQVDGRLHAQFHPLRADDGGTVSGRASSSHPNLQNLPSLESAFGKIIRGFLLPQEGEMWAALDYSQQEPRMAVHFAALSELRGAQAAVDAYWTNADQDFHQLVADLTGLPRKRAKVINLGMLYGMGGALLCKSLGLPVVQKQIRNGKVIEVPGPEGEDIIQQYHRAMPWIKTLQDSVQRKAEQRGYIRTLLGRRCRFGDGKDFPRKALNRLIQGSSADQTKLAMLHNWREHGLVPLVQVHDELGYSVPDREVAEKLAKGMIDCVQLKVPSKVDVEMGPNWGEVLKAA